MKFAVKRSTELSDAEKRSFCDLFEEVFAKPKSLERFERQFMQTPLGYSYHGLMLDDADQILGAYTTIPLPYEIGGVVQTIGLCVDTMISTRARGQGGLKKLADETYARLVQDGIPFVFGFPNENIYLIRKKRLKWADIGTLDYYVLPLRPDLKDRRLLLTRPACLGLAAVLNAYVRVRKAPARSEPPFFVRKVDDAHFRRFRYGPEHSKVELPDAAEAFYAVTNVHDSRSVFLLDVVPLTRGALEQAVSHLSAIVDAKTEAIVYVGHLEERPANLFRLPPKLWPKPVRMAGRILIPGAIDERVLQLSSWRVNFADFDVV